MNSNPLDGKGVLVTRPAQQAESLCQLLTENGAIPIRFPTLVIQPAADPALAKTQLAQAEQADWLIFISANAVEQALALLPLPARPKLAAIGKATARALLNAGRKPDLVPASGNDSEALLALPELQRISSQRIVIVRGVGGRETLAETLRARGAMVEYAEVYRRTRPSADAAELIERWCQGQIHVATATSNETLQNLYDMLGPEGRTELLATPLIVVSPRAAQLARDLGFNKPAIVTAEASDQAILEALRQLFPPAAL